MEITAAYGIALPEARPASQATPVAGPPAGGFGGFGVGDLLAFNRWETAAVGAALVIGLALYANALYDAA